MKLKEFNLDEIQAWVESIELCVWIFIRLERNGYQEEYPYFLKLLQIHTPNQEVWKSNPQIWAWIHTLWEKKNNYTSFIRILREFRDSLLIHISQDVLRDNPLPLLNLILYDRSKKKLLLSNRDLEMLGLTKEYFFYGTKTEEELAALEILVEQIMRSYWEKVLNNKVPLI